MGLYIVANVDGNVISSTDGLVWSEPFDTGINIRRVAIGPNKIIYTSSDGGIYYTNAWNETPNMAAGSNGYSFREVDYLGGKFVAVGYKASEGGEGLNDTPAHAYSENGITWTIIDEDPEFCNGLAGGEDFTLNDIGYNGTGYFIVSSIDGENVGGGFYTLDITQQLGESQWINPENFPVDADHLVFAEYPEGGENFGIWSVFSEDQKTWWSTASEDPSNIWSFITDWDLSEVLFDQVGLTNLQIAEATIGLLTDQNSSQYVTWMLSTENGQIMWWPHAPLGPFVSVPNPYTSAVESINNLNPLQVVLSGSNLPTNNEKIKISGATGLTSLNDSYFVESIEPNVYRLHSSKELDSVIDASGWSGVYDNQSATASLSQGTYIDALSYGNGKFFAGNDDEEVFVCSEISSYGELIWNKVEDLNNSLEFWNDVAYGDFNGCSTTFTFDLSPDNPETIPNYQYDGEGNMDTAIIIKDGKRISIQRTGYFEFIDNCGNRKVASVKDGQTIVDSPDNIV